MPGSADWDRVDGAVPLTLRKALVRNLGVWARILLAAGLVACADDESAAPAADTISQQDMGGPGVIGCQLAVDCAALAVGPCDVPQCLDGACMVQRRPACCDKDNDTCGPGAVCEGSVNRCIRTTADECVSAGDCAGDAALCERSLCATGACAYYTDPECCVADADCDDGDACTTERCDAGRCARETPATCCLETAYFAGFSDVLDGFLITGNGQAARWHYTEERVHTPPGALRFADPASGRYENPVGDDGERPPSQGRLALPRVVVPARGGRVAFWLYLDVETLPEFDLFGVEADLGLGPVPVWTKVEFLGAYREWSRVEVNLVAFAGETLELSFVVDTVDGTVNIGEGVFVDDVVVYGECAEGCTADEECDDGSPCTADRCVEGRCASLQIAACCVTNADCDDENPCTVDACGGQVCVNAPIAGCCVEDVDCEDSVACTTDRCVAGGCAWVLDGIADPPCCAGDAQCEDGDPCTLNQCDTVCRTTPVAGPGCCEVDANCGDDDPCTADRCIAGQCAALPATDCCVADADCADASPCTSNLCVDGSCRFALIPGCCAKNVDCTDGIDCTVDKCNTASKTCEYQLLAGCCLDDTTCDDGDPCTLDDCAANHRCVEAHPAISGCCASDADCGAPGDKCSSVTCEESRCVERRTPGCCASPLDCDDANDCTLDVCADGGCSYTALVACCSSAAACADENPCTTEECADGECVVTLTPGCAP